MEIFVSVLFVLVFVAGCYIGYRYGRAFGMRFAAVEIFGKEIVTYAEIKFQKIEEVIAYLKEKV